MDKIDYENKLYEQLQWCISDSFSFGDFYFIDETMNLEKQREFLTISVDFLYKCLKFGLLVLDMEYDEFPYEKIRSLDDLMNSMLLINEVHMIEIKSWKHTNSLNQFIWLVVQVSGTNKLAQISSECLLDEYDDFNLNSSGQKNFKEIISGIFSSGKQ